MWRRSLQLIAIVSAVLLCRPVARARNSVEIWFAPAPGSLDMLQLFEAEDEWPIALQRMGVFKFYQGHVLEPPAGINGPNTYQAFYAVGAFQKLTQVWHKRIAIEVGAVKEFYCTTDDSGMTTAITNTLRAIAAVQAAGGEVAYLAMDEPFLAGTSQKCGGPDPGPTVQRLERYVKAVGGAYPTVEIGLIEPHPYFNVAQLAGFLSLMKARGIPVAFLHVDVDLNALKGGRDDFARDMTELASVCNTQQIPFGIIIWGRNGDSDALYVDDAMKLVRLIKDTFGEWDQMPDHLIFQSWAESMTGLRITPTNLPESALNTHTNLIKQGLRLLRGPREIEERGGRRPYGK